MFDVNIRFVEHNSNEYNQEIELRQKILREPLGLHFTKKELDQESNQLHICAFIIDTLAGCVVMVPNGTVLRMRQVAVGNDYQGLGIGKLLVQFCEKYAVENDYKCIKLHARENAVPFYTKLDYKTEGDQFIEVGIPHFAMSKYLK
ncbi:hypothetical protein HK103_007569 [Boothiomyces macroporosus]|uniref:N-acetyltransferase domain-containing protein n=1 Tax=Boothiomyces macroporosus TaxID=261099 RepID=A0AAD5Y3X1_9FUNG|nr:hypothetical protein HK103_007569 [Boothiomyces macroporosus]